MMINCKYYDKNSKPCDMKDDFLIMCNYHNSYKYLKKDCQHCSIKYGKLYVLFFRGVFAPSVDFASYEKYEVVDLYNERIGEDKRFENLYYIKVFDELEF